ncbi:S24 family peptidase [Oceanimonas sp. NS1]|nr:S24 family peptidase [Oceanimonas sp. NS1]
MSAALRCTKIWIEFGDNEHEPSNVTAGPEIKGQFPLISWVAAGAWHDITEIHPSEAPLYPCPVKCSDKTFVLRVQGISMEPLFRDGDLIFIDPNAEWRHGSYVVARLDDHNEATFKQLVIESGQKYLKPLNKDWPEKIIPINGNCTIVGPVVFSGRAF